MKWNWGQCVGIMLPLSSVLQKRKNPIIRGAKWKNPPQMIGGDKKAQMEWGLHTAYSHLEGQTRCVWDPHCLICVWKVKWDGVWDAHHLVHIWKAEWASVWGAHHFAGFWNDTAGGRRHKCPPHLQFLFSPPSPSYSCFLLPPTPISALLALSVFMMWCSMVGTFVRWCGNGGCHWWWVMWCLRWAMQHLMVAQRGHWGWVTWQMLFAYIPQWGEGGSSDGADAGTVERQWCGMVGGHWHQQWAHPHLAHVGSHEGDSGGGGGGNVWGGCGKNKRSDGAMFGNRWLPNIAIIINQYFNY